MFEQELESLREEFGSGRFAHAYLLVGEEGRGVFEAVMEFSREKRKEKREKGSDLDLVVLEGSESLKIKEIQDLNEVVFRTTVGGLRLVVVENVERMTGAAANAFLKTLEEPPEGTVFLLVCSDFTKIIPTIVSRTRVVHFREGNKEIKKEGNEELAREVRFLMEEGTVVARFKFVETVAEERGKAKGFLDALTLYFRERMLKEGEQSLLAAEKLSKIADAGMLLEQNVNVRLLLENLMLDL